MLEITKQLIKEKDDINAAFVSKLTPNLNKSSVLGVKNPVIKKIAKHNFFSDETTKFFNSLPHTYYEEDIAHGYALSFYKTFSETIDKLTVFLPYINTWGVCDVTACCLKIFSKHLKELWPYVEKWLQSDHSYTVRFGIVTLLGYYINPQYIEKANALVKAVESNDYYIQMAQAWYFSVALVKEYEQTIDLIVNNVLPTFVHQKTIQKACESRRISLTTKEYLKTLRRAKTALHHEK